MLCIAHGELDPYFNLAAEEYILKHREEDFFMLWRNAPSVIVGKHQNSIAEIDADYVEKEGIKVVRRLTGGGAVCHDLGNLNFTFIEQRKHQDINFQRYTLPIIEVLRSLGLQAEFSGRNDILAEGKKISGNAETVWQNRVLHHGTLLYSADLDRIAAALRPRPEKFTDKAVKSVRSRITNIAQLLGDATPDILKFRDYIMERMLQTNGATRYDFTTEDIQAIQKLRDEKYSRWEWNYGTSPKYTFRNSMQTPAGWIELQGEVSDGLIRAIKIYGDFFTDEPIEALEGLLSNIEHRPEAITHKLKSIDINRYILGLDIESLTKLLV